MRTLVRLPSCSAIREVQAEICKEGSAGPTAPMTTPAVAPATGPAAPSMWHNLAGMGGRRWAGMGALAGGALGALMPGKDEDGESRGALSGALRGAMAGGIAGGLGGMAAKRMWGPTGAMKTMEGATQAGEGVVAGQTAGAAAAAKAQMELANRRAKHIYDPSRTDIVQHATGRKDTWGNRLLSGVQGVLPRFLGGTSARNQAESAAGLVHSREVAAAGLQTKRDAELAAARGQAPAGTAVPGAGVSPAADAPPVALPQMNLPLQAPTIAAAPPVAAQHPSGGGPALPPAPAPIQAPAMQPMGGRSAPVALPPLAFPSQPAAAQPAAAQPAAAQPAAAQPAAVRGMEPDVRAKLIRAGWREMADGRLAPPPKTAAFRLSPIDVFSPKLAARRPFSAPKQTVAERVQGAFAPRKTKADTAPVAAEAAEQPKATPAAKPKEAPEAADDKKVAASPAVAATMPPGAGPATAVAPLKTSEVAVPIAAVVEPAKAAEAALAAIAEPAIKVVKLAALAA